MSTDSTKPRVVRLNTRKKNTPPTPDFLEVSDLGAHMRGKIKPPAMLLDDWLQENVLHWAQGEPEDGKSWVMLWCLVKLLQENDDARVLIMDGEMGSRSVAERLQLLGLDPGTAEARVTHVNLSAVSREHFEDFVLWAVAMRFTLIIWDPIAHHLAGAAVNENSNSEVVEWIAHVVNPLLANGATVVGVDHVVKSGDRNGYARGASAKKARARIVYDFEKGTAFDRETLGEVIVRLEKNSDAAPIPKERQIILGGHPGGGQFVFRVSDREPVPRVDRRREAARSVVEKAASILEKKGGELSESALYKQIGGKKQATINALREAAKAPGGRLDQRLEQQGARSFLYYSLRADDGTLRL